MHYNCSPCDVITINFLINTLIGAEIGWKLFHLRPPVLGLTIGLFAWNSLSDLICSSERPVF